MPYWPETQYVARDNLEFIVLLPPFLKCWVYRYVPLHMVLSSIEN